MDLSFHNHWVYDVTHIIDRNKSFQLYLPCFFVDFDNGYMATKREGEICGIVKTAEVESRLKVFRINMRNVSGQCNVSKAYRFICSFYGKFSMLEIHIVCIRFQ